MKLVVLTGAGMSAESGIKTFRDSDGLWENYRIEDVCTQEALERNPELVIGFYNQRRKELYNARPNAGHVGLAKLEQYFDVQIITQNIDDLHERAGSKHVLHLHGELKKVRSSINPELITDLKGWELKPGTRCEDGSMLRPHVVFFGEAVPNIEPATELVRLIFSLLLELHWQYILPQVCFITRRNIFLYLSSTPIFRQRPDDMDFV